MTEPKALFEFRRPVAPEWLVWVMFVLIVAAILLIIASVSYIVIGAWHASLVASQISCAVGAVDGLLLLTTRSAA